MALRVEAVAERDAGLGWTGRRRLPTAGTIAGVSPSRPTSRCASRQLSSREPSGSALRFGVVVGKAYRGAIATRDVQPGGERGRRPRATSPQPHGADDRPPLALRRCLRGGGGGGGDVR